jgi:hypothetical protein
LGAYFRIRESEDIQLIVFLWGDMVSDTEEDSGGIKTPKQLITVLLLAIVFPIAIVVMLAQYATGGISVDKNDPTLTDESVAKRLKPVSELVMAIDLPPSDANSGSGIVQTASAASTPAASGADKIQEIYNASCAACHMSGAAGAPSRVTRRHGLRGSRAAMECSMPAQSKVRMRCLLRAVMLACPMMMSRRWWTTW